MSEYQEIKIVDNLLSTLESITIANGYSLDVARVARNAQTIAELAPEDVPYIGIMGDGTREYTETPGLLHVQWSIPMAAVYQDNGEDDGDDERATNGVLLALQRFMSDIRRAIYLDVTRGADPDSNSGDRNAIWTKVRTTKAERMLDRRQGQIEFDTVVKYITTPTGA